MAGSNCIQETEQVLAGLSHQAHLLSAGDSSAGPAGSSRGDISSNNNSSKAAAAAATSQQQRPTPAAAAVHPAAFCSSKPAGSAAQHTSAPCRTTQHAEQGEAGLVAACWCTGVFIVRGRMQLLCRAAQVVVPAMHES